MENLTDTEKYMAEKAHIYNIDEKVMVIEPHPNSHKNPYYDKPVHGVLSRHVQMRQELFVVNNLRKKKAKEHLIEVLKSDMAEEAKLLKNYGIAFLETNR